MGAIVVAVVAGTIAGVIARATAPESRSSVAAVATSSDNRCPAVSIADAVLPSVVTLSVRGSDNASSSGSGEVIRTGGYILTNNHVIAAAAAGGSIDVLFNDGNEYPAHLIGRSSQLDLAVVKVDVGSSLPTIRIGDSESLRVGQPVVALGAPLGLDGTVTSGIVSALGRKVTVPADAGQTAVLPSAIQTDASINPGNSGGALVDCAGNLIGVNTAIATVPNASGTAGGGNVGIGFAIPVDLAVTVSDDLISTGQFTAAYFGASTSPIPASVAASAGVSEGLFIQTVDPGGPAAKAGLRAQDIMTEIDGARVDGPDALSVATLTHRPGDTLKITYVRAGQPGTANVTLGSR